MAELKVIDAIVAAVKAAWPDGIVMDDENENWAIPSAPDLDAAAPPFIVIKFPYSTAKPASIGAPGDNWHREEGSALIELRVERNSGARPAREICRTIAAALRDRDLGDGIKTWSPTSPVRDDRNAVGAYYALVFAVPYWCDIRG